MSMYNKVMDVLDVQLHSVQPQHLNLLQKLLQLQREAQEQAAVMKRREHSLRW